MLVNEQESTTTDAGALWLHEAQHCMGRNCGIDSMTTLFKHLDRGSDGVRIRCGRYCPAVPGSARLRICARTDGGIGTR
jgi:hypothetical protein